MKLLYKISLGILWQMLLIKSLDGNSIEFSAQYLYHKTVRSEMFNTEKHFVAAAKNLSENILKDKIVEKSSSPYIKQLKLNINNFLQKYAHFQRYGLYQELVTLFYENYPKFTNNSDYKYISQLYKKYDFNVINKKYQMEFVKLVREKLPKEFENFSKKLSNKNLVLKENLLKWLKKAKNCENFYCALYQLEQLRDIIYSPKDLITYNFLRNQQINRIFYTKSAYDIVKRVLKDSQLKQLNPELYTNFVKDIKEFMQKYETNKSVSNLFKILQIYRQNIILKYYNNQKLPSKDLKIIKEIFNKYGYLKLEMHINL
ncbi:uncharacterized protein ACRADG_005232 [Cochliomyia hominivorax]